MAVRNSAVARGTLPTTGGNFVYTVPDGFVLLLKNILLTASGLPAMTVSATVTNSDASVQLPLFYTQVATLTVFNWSGWTALNAADRLIISSNVASTQYWVSGALLPFNAAL